MNWLVSIAFAADPPPNVWPKDAPYPADGIPRPEGEAGPATAGEAVAVERAATSILVGRLLEMGSGLPVTDGEVRLGPTGGEPRWRTTLQADGSFRFSVPPGSWDLAYEGIDHKPLAARITVGEREQVDVELRADRATWETITVYGEPRREEVSRKVITADELNLVPGSFGDPIRALQSLPGVARPATLEGDIVVRGAEAVNTGTYIDEIPVPYLFHFFIGRSVVNPALIDDVEFFAGGMPSRFGDVTQAVVNARTLDTKPNPGFHGRVSADVLDFAVSGEARLSDAFTVQGGYRLSWVSGLITGGVSAYARLKGLGGDFRPAFPTIAYEDHLARVAWEQGRDRVVLTFLGAHDTLAIHPPRADYDGDGDVEDPPVADDLPYDPWRLMDSGFQRVQLRWDRKDGEREQATWIAAGPDSEESLLQGLGTIADGVDFGRLGGWTILAKRQDRVPVGEDVVRFGADALVVPVTVEDYAEIDEDGNATTTKEVRTSVGAWGEYQLALGDAFLAPGLRLATHAFNDQTRFEPEPRVTLRKPLADRWTGTAFLGRFTQVPPADRYADGIGNPALTRMTSYQASIGIEGRWPSGVEVDGTLYASRMEHLVVKDVEVEIREVRDIGGYYGESAGYAEAVYVPTFHEVDGWAFGFDGMARLRPNGPHFGWVALSIGKSLRVDDGEVRPGDYDLPFSITGVYARSLPYDIRVSGKVRVTSGYPFTPISGVYLSDEDHWHGLSGEQNSERFPLYRQLDLRVDRTWTGERARWIAYVDVFNVFNTKNWMLATYTPNYTRLVPTIWMPILPTVGVEVRY